jgi:putative hydrolases of HD superfamily
MLERLKTMKREGWRRFGIKEYVLPLSFYFTPLADDIYHSGESIADHMYRMSLICMFAPPSLSSKLNIPHCSKMALVHDMAEALVGDITPVDGVAKPEKNRRESTTMDYFTTSLLGKVNGGITGQELKDIWQEYEDSETLESKFVHDVDKLELVLQMIEYERVHEHQLDLGEFTWVAGRIVLAEVKAWAEEILAEREVFWGAKTHTNFYNATKPDAKNLAQKLEYYGEKENGGVGEKP